ncbi:MAG: helix-turn-helix domain-containing protein [Campylobacterota bacterium]|nr:helix-turn-helix domain-containing protein [Campylobacterota bacterium]
MTTEINKESKKILLAEIQTEWITPNAVQKQYGFSTSTLAKWRMDNKNLPFSKMGKYIRYKRSDIEAFIESNKVEVAS